MTEARQWSLDTARAMLPEVRKRTGRTVEVLEALGRERDGYAESAPEHVELSQKMRIELAHWVREMEALGVVVKGLWLIDFDTGGGYYCWRWPEESLDYFHGYDEGFKDRARIQ